MTLYAKLVNGRVDQESARDSSEYDFPGDPLEKRPGYVPVLAVRAEGVAEIRQEIARDWSKGQRTFPLDRRTEDRVKESLRWSLRALGLEEKP